MIPAEAVTVTLAKDALAAMPDLLDAVRAMTDHLADELVRVIEAEARGDLAEADAIARPWIAAIDKAMTAGSASSQHRRGRRDIHT